MKSVSVWLVSWAMALPQAAIADVSAGCGALSACIHVSAPGLAGEIGGPAADFSVALALREPSSLLLLGLGLLLFGLNKHFNRR